jgi:large subunit ribosomal protein L32
MAVPKKKTSKSKKGMRRSHDGLPAGNIVECNNCGIFKVPHHVCIACGWYAGKVIITQKDRSEEDEEEE